MCVPYQPQGPFFSSQLVTYTVHMKHSMIHAWKKCIIPLSNNASMSANRSCNVTAEACS